MGRKEIVEALKSLSETGRRKAYHRTYLTAGGRGLIHFYAIWTDHSGRRHTWSLGKDLNKAVKKLGELDIVRNTKLPFVCLDSTPEA